MTLNATASGVRPIRVGLIGAGNWTHHGHLPVLMLLPDYQIAAIQSRRREVAVSLPHSRTRSECTPPSI